MCIWTKDDFELAVAQHHGMTIENFRKEGYIALPCSCGNWNCQGWRIFNVYRMSEDEIDRLSVQYRDEVQAIIDNS